MAHLESSFSSPHAGKLEITLSGTYQQNTYRDAGFPETTNSANWSVRGYVGPDDGTRKYCEPIDRYAPVSVMEMDYPGGSVSWPFGTQTVAQTSPGGGLWTYGMRNLRMKILLIKK